MAGSESTAAHGNTQYSAVGSVPSRAKEKEAMI